MFLRSAIILLFLLLFADIEAQHTPTFQTRTMFYMGQVTRVTDNSAVADVTISADDYGVVGNTSIDGTFKIEAPVNVSRLSFSKSGLMNTSIVFITENDRMQHLAIKMFPEDATEAEQQLILENYPLGAANEASGELLKSNSLLKSTAKTDVPATLRVLMSNNSVVVMSMDEYLKGVVPSEVPPSWNMNALKAQAVAARSYAAANFKHNSEGADVCTTTHCQAWKSTHYSRTDQAVMETSNMSVKYAGNIINALFFSHCDGHTRNNEAVWGGTPVPYLRGKSCTCGYTSHNAHGVGMCQYGIQAMATAGSTWENILTYYYTGVIVDKPNIALGTLTGVIYHGNDNQNLNNRIAGATVRLNTGQELVSGANGLYSFNLVPGQYTVTASMNGFQSNSLIRDVVAGNTIWGSIQLSQATGIKDVTTANGLIYPIPAKDYITIETKGKAHIVIFDITGRELLNQAINETTTLPLTGFKSGVYIVHITENGYTLTQEVVVTE